MRKHEERVKVKTKNNKKLKKFLKKFSQTMTVFVRVREYNGDAEGVIVGRAQAAKEGEKP